MRDRENRNFGRRILDSYNKICESKWISVRHPQSAVTTFVVSLVAVAGTMYFAMLYHPKEQSSLTPSSLVSPEDTTQDYHPSNLSGLEQD